MATLFLTVKRILCGSHYRSAFLCTNYVLQSKIWVPDSVPPRSRHSILLPIKNSTDLTMSSSSNGVAAAAAAPGDADKKETKPPSSGATNDFVIRDGFPALRTETGEPLIEGDEPIPRAPFLSYSSALLLLDKQQQQQQIVHDCRAVFSARTKESDAAAYSAGCTYFCPAVMKPRCALEALALEIFHAHVKDLPKKSYMPEQSGAEWWTLVLDPDPPKPENEDDDDEEEDHDEVGMHFDADYGLEDQAPGLLLHPRVATITYLTSHGAPTLILDKKSPPPNEVESMSGDISRGWLSGPQRGKHVAFDGRLLHGAPATFFPGVAVPFTTDNNADDDEPPAKRQKLEEEEDRKPAAKGDDESKDEEKPTGTTAESPEPQRITFMVNVWLNHCPLDAELLDDDIVQQLQTPPDTKWGLSLDKPDEPQQKSLNGIYKEDPGGEEETVICNRVVTLFYNDKLERQHEISQSLEGKSVELEFKDGSLRLEVGGEPPQEEEGGSDEEEDK